MAQQPAKRTRISIDVAPELRRRLQLAAARSNLTVRRYVLEAIGERLQADLGDEARQRTQGMSNFMRGDVFVFHDSSSSSALASFRSAVSNPSVNQP